MFAEAVTRSSAPEVANARADGDAGEWHDDQLVARCERVPLPAEEACLAVDGGDRAVPLEERGGVRNPPRRPLREADHGGRPRLRARATDRLELRVLHRPGRLLEAAVRVPAEVE